MKKGYIKLYRKTIESPIFMHEGMLKLWVLCLLKANHKQTDFVLPGILKPITLKPGQFITGRYELHRDYHQADIQKRKYSRKCKPTPYTLIRWLLTLQYMQMLSNTTYNKYSIISITNWYLYQENEHQVSIRRASSEHIQECIKNEKEIYAQNFLSFWEAYPNRKSKKKAYEAWNKLEKAEDITTLLPILLDAIERQRQARESVKAKGEFFPEWPYPATWLNGKRWEDEVEIKQGYDGF